MKTRLNYFTQTLCLTALAAYSVFQTKIFEHFSEFNASFYATIGIYCVGVLAIFTSYARAQFNKRRIKSWRAYSAKTTRSAHKFIIDRIVDLRRPLQGLVGIHDLYTSASSHQEGLDFLDIADFCSRYLIRQLERIQFYSEFELGHLRFEKKTFSLHKCVQDAITLATEQAKSNRVTIVEEFSPSTPEFVYGNELSLRKLLIELIDNSVRHAGNTKTIIRIQPDPEFSERLRFVVSDTGPGISSEKVQSILMPLPVHDRHIPWRDAREGLGLILVKKILHKLDGSLNASSQIGMGTTLSFCLPESELSSAHKPETTVADILPKLRVLVVDDEEVTRQVLSALFRRIHIKADIAVNGYDAIEKAKVGNYDLIIMDLSMPVIDGFAASRTILNLDQLKHKPKIVIASSHCRQEDRNRCDSIGVHSFIAKPLRFETLKQTLAALGFNKAKDNGKFVDNVVQVDFRGTRSKVASKEAGYYINFNSLYNSLDENLALCNEILTRVSKDVTQVLEVVALALKNEDRKALSLSLHRIHGELSMVHCAHGLETVQNMQMQIEHATPAELQIAFEKMSEFIDNLCEEIGRLTHAEGESKSA